MRVLRLSATIEAATGLAVLAVPGVGARLLLGVELSGVSPLLARCFGIALIALSLACWPGARQAAELIPACRGMLLYNAAIAVTLAYAGAIGHLAGVLLWPAVALHAVVALLLGVPARGR